MKDRAHWHEKSFRRNLVDMHIDDWNEVFLSRFDAKQYFDCLKDAHIQSPMIYLQSHVGLCNWPTESGRMHAGFRGVNKVRELIDLCHAEGMHVVGYYSLIYNNWAYDTHPDWRMRDAAGNPSRNDAAAGFTGGWRYGLVCPNHPGYRQFVLAQFGELLEAYPIEGIFLDMTFWPMVCHCEQCRSRFRLETGLAVPEQADWDHADWRLFQACRERWLNEFASFCTGALKRLQPDLTVEHQLSTIHQDWMFGVNGGVNEASDYAGGDLYGGPLQESFICKLYWEITKNRPFEYMTSRCDPDLLDHTTTKSLDSLRLHNFLALAHHGATLFIDAIDPDGTLDPKVYATIGEVFAESIPYEPYLTGELIADTAVYYSLGSKMNACAKGDRDRSIPQLEAALGASAALSGHHCLHTVIPSSRMERCAGMKTVILCQATFLSEEEIAFFMDYVALGGCLYLSGYTSPELAGRLLGLEFLGHTAERVTYLAPTAEGQTLFGPYTREHPLAYRDPQVLMANPQGKQVLATVALPYTDPADGTRFAAIHSNPPGVQTDFPALVFGRCGKGKVVWSAAPFEKDPQKAHKDVFYRIIQYLRGESPALETTAPPYVQFTVFDDARHGCLRISAVNVQEHEPAIPAGRFTVRLKTDTPVRTVTLLPDATPVDFSWEGGVLSFTVPGLELFGMIEARYGPEQTGGIPA